MSGESPYECGGAPSRTAIDAVKGIAIVCIVVGHNTDITIPFPWVYTAFYSFHVWVFLLLPFLPLDRFSRSTWLDRSVRYLTPYVWSVIVASLLYRLMLAHSEPISEWLSKVIQGLAIGSAPLLDAACGFQLYGFLPALWTVVMVRDLSRATPRWFRIAAWLACGAVAMTVGGYPQAVKTFAPFGILIAAYVLWVGPLAAWAAQGNFARRPWGLIVVSLAWVLGTRLHLDSGANSNLGVLKLYTIAQPANFLVQSALPVLAFTTLLVVGPLLAHVSWLGLLGRHSLVIYLAHSFALQAFHMGAAKLLPQQSPSAGLNQLFLASASTLFALVLSLLASLAINALPRLRRRVLPRNVADLVGH